MQFPAIRPLDTARDSEIRARIDSLTKPVGSLGMLETIARRIALIQGTTGPALRKKRIYVFAGDHGIAEEGVSAFPQEVTREMVRNFLHGGAAINVFSRHNGTEVFVVDAGVKYDLPEEEVPAGARYIVKKVGYGTRNFLREDAMTADELAAALAHGFDLAQKAYDEGVDILVLGDMGIGNTTTATAIAAAAGIDGNAIIDIGTVIDGETLKRKMDVITRALAARRPDPKNAADILRKLGGYCIAEMTGAIMQAASLRMPVVLDGYPVTSAAIMACLFEPAVKDYLFAGHQSAVRGHKVLLDHIGLEPVLQLKMRLGEGTGGVLALSIIEAAVKMMSEMATFESAGVSKGSETAVQ